MVDNYEERVEQIGAIDEDSLSEEDYAYLYDAQTRINERQLEIDCE